MPCSIYFGLINIHVVACNVNIEIEMQTCNLVHFVMLIYDIVEINKGNSTKLRKEGSDVNFVKIIFLYATLLSYLV